ncbi:MAG: histidine kinase, partial [Flavobacteriales bacterium]|nr:histidine kinase [Flavobacteriales bacterium]
GLDYGQLPANLSFPSQEKHFSFYFDGLALTYPDEVKYQFKMNGVDNKWQAITDVDFTTYGNLTHSDYSFEVRAIDAFGRAGLTQKFDFTVLTPFWLKWWFIALEVLLVLSIIGLIYRSRANALRNKLEKEKYEFKSKMLALEQQTLNSSMNRHFIFNALNSIQFYINTKDRLSANKYLSSFAKLIRKNLDSSQSNLTSLEEELERLELYLSLEKMRFKDRFEYSIDIADGIDPASINVPAMMLQPFLENSIWHGILPKEGDGIIDLKIKKIDEQRVAFHIMDNGIGIETSLKNKQDSEDHISQGMEITSGRIELIKKMTHQNVELIGPRELKNGSGTVDGTEVQIIIPMNFHME